MKSMNVFVKLIIAIGLFLYDALIISVWLGHLKTHWGQVMQTCVSKLFIIGSDNGLSTGRRQAIIWNNAGILLNGLLGSNFSEIKSYTFSFKKMAAILSQPHSVKIQQLSDWMHWHGSVGGFSRIHIQNHYRTNTTAKNEYSKFINMGDI